MDTRASNAPPEVHGTERLETQPGWGRLMGSACGRVDAGSGVRSDTRFLGS